MNVDTKEIQALIQLIDDPCDEVFATVRERIMSYGGSIIPKLEICWETQDYGLTFQDRVANIIHDLQFQQSESDLRQWLASSERCLLEGTLIVSQFIYPSLDISKVHRFVDQIERDVWLEYNDELTALEQVKILNHIFFHEYGFKGDSHHFHAPENSIITDVIDSRKGNPLSLSVIYSIVAQRLKIPVYGVNLPKHFVLAYVDQDNLLGILTGENQTEQNVLFYINAFSKGVVFDKNDIDEFLVHLNLPQKEKYYAPCSNSDMIKRMLVNLRYSYAKRENRERVEELDRLIEVLNQS